MTSKKKVERFAVNDEWSEGEIIYLCSEWAKGTPITRIAEDMERTPQTIKRKVRLIGLTPRASCAVRKQPPHASTLSPTMPVFDNGEGFFQAIKTLRG